MSFSVPTANEAARPTRSTGTTTTLAGRNYLTRQAVLRLSRIKPFLHCKKTGESPEASRLIPEGPDQAGPGWSIDGRNTARRHRQGHTRDRSCTLKTDLGGAKGCVGLMGAGWHYRHRLLGNSLPITYHPPAWNFLLERTVSRLLGRSKRIGYWRTVMTSR